MRKKKTRGITPEEWQRRGLEAERQGFELTVVGRPRRRLPGPKDWSPRKR